MRIEICGGIASGKTTLARLLEGEKFNCLFEDFTANPFWQSFYSNPGKFIFETEITFLLQHYHQIKVIAQDQFVVCDFGLTLDRAYADIGLSGERHAIFASIYDEVLQELGPPSYLIHLQCSPEVELQRISERGRSTESSISLDFLQSLNTSLSSVVAKQQHVPTLAINSANVDFAHSPQDRDAIQSQIHDWISSSVRSGLQNAVKG